ncbi:hypothetical protein OHC33_002191 [Knufia fluminis]|uniref:Uncharacterized protein n=1 Tax=Knufia fluminis TaxID=191047 RepID=A0AAN8I801_9EURO|nr:hypothetical protein OHC33_002191 [Knufia fluminis]
MGVEPYETMPDDGDGYVTTEEVVEVTEYDEEVSGDDEEYAPGDVQQAAHSLSTDYYDQPDAEFQEPVAFPPQELRQFQQHQSLGTQSLRPPIVPRRPVPIPPTKPTRLNQWTPPSSARPAPRNFHAGSEHPFGGLARQQQPAYLPRPAHQPQHEHYEELGYQLHEQQSVYQQRSLYEPQPAYQQQSVYPSQRAYGPQPEHQEQPTYRPHEQQSVYPPQHTYQQQPAYRPQPDHQHQPTYQPPPPPPQITYTPQPPYQQQSVYPQQDPAEKPSAYQQEPAPRIVTSETSYVRSTSPNPYEYSTAFEGSAVPAEDDNWVDEPEPEPVSHAVSPPETSNYAGVASEPDQIDGRNKHKQRDEKKANGKDNDRTAKAKGSGLAALFKKNKKDELARRDKEGPNTPSSGQNGAKVEKRGFAALFRKNKKHILAQANGKAPSGGVPEKLPPTGTSSADANKSAGNKQVEPNKPLNSSHASDQLNGWVKTGGDNSSKSAGSLGLQPGSLTANKTTGVANGNPSPSTSNALKSDTPTPLNNVRAGSKNTVTSPMTNTKPDTTKPLPRNPSWNIGAASSNHKVGAETKADPSDTLTATAPKEALRPGQQHPSTNTKDMSTQQSGSTQPSSGPANKPKPPVPGSDKVNKEPSAQPSGPVKQNDAPMTAKQAKSKAFFAKVRAKRKAKSTQPQAPESNVEKSTMAPQAPNNTAENQAAAKQPQKSTTAPQAPTSTASNQTTSKQPPQSQAKSLFGGGSENKEKQKQDQTQIAAKQQQGVKQKQTWKEKRAAKKAANSRSSSRPPQQQSQQQQPKQKPQKQDQKQQPQPQPKPQPQQQPKPKPPFNKDQKQYIAQENQKLIHEAQKRVAKQQKKDAKKQAKQQKQLAKRQEQEARRAVNPVAQPNAKAQPAKNAQPRPPTQPQVKQVKQKPVKAPKPPKPPKKAKAPKQKRKRGGKRK